MESLVVAVVVDDFGDISSSVEGSNNDASLAESGA